MGKYFILSIVYFHNISINIPAAKGGADMINPIIRIYNKVADRKRFFII